MFGGTVNEKTFAFAKEYFFWIALGIPVYVFGQAMNKAVASTAISMIREIVFGVGLVLVLPLVWGLDGVIISMPAADILAFIASAIVIIYTYRTLKKDESRKLA